MLTRRTPPMLPARRARLHALQASVRAALRAVRSGQGRVLPRVVDTSAIDAAWPEAQLAAGPLDRLAALVRARKTGRASSEHALARAAVVLHLETAGIREVRVGDVTFRLGEACAVQIREGEFNTRSGALRVTLAKPAKGAREGTKAKGGVNLGRVRAALQEAAAGARGDVVNLADYRARRTA